MSRLTGPALTRPPSLIGRTVSKDVVETSLVFLRCGHSTVLIPSVTPRLWLFKSLFAFPRRFGFPQFGSYLNFMYFSRNGETKKATTRRGRTTLAENSVSPMSRLKIIAMTTPAPMMATLRNQAYFNRLKIVIFFLFQRLKAPAAER